MTVDLLNYAVDDTNSPVAGATVTATGRGAGGTHTTTTNASGQWSFTGLPDDTYDVEVTKNGKSIGYYGDIKVQVAGFVSSSGAAAVADGSITTAKLADNSVTSAKIVAGAVGASDLASNAVATANVQDGAITSTKLAAGAVTQTAIAAGAVGTTQVQDGSITSAKLAADVSTGGGGTVSDGSITTAKLADLAVTQAKIANAAVGSTQLATGAVTSTKLAADSVGSSAIAAGAVGTSELANGAVGSTQLASSAVTAGKIATGGVSATAQIADGIITSAKLAFTPATAISAYLHDTLDSNVPLTGTSEATANTIANLGLLPAGLYLFYINAEVDISSPGAGARIALYNGSTQIDPDIYVNWPSGLSVAQIVPASGVWIVNLASSANMYFKGYKNIGSGTATVFGSTTFPTTGFGYVKLA